MTNPTQNLIQNGTFPTDTAYWFQAGTTSWGVTGGKLVAQIPAKKATGPGLYDVMIGQNVPLPAPGDYRLIFEASASVPVTITIANGPVATVDLTPTPTVFDVPYHLDAPIPASQVQFLLGLAADVPWTFTLDNVIMNPPLAIFSTVTAPATNADPILIDVTGLYAGQVVQVWRTVGNAKERVLGVATADAAGALHMTDHLYPFTSEVGYLIFNALGTEVIHTTATVRTPASLFPVIRDAQLPELFWSRVLIVDVTNRVRQGRVTVYRIVSEFYPVTVGDIRDASEGVLTLFCLDHADRDRVIETLSSGGPCVLRIPAPCRRVVDDMYFTPVDITEARWGDNGRCILTVDFVEVGGTAIPEYRAVTYDAQSTAADGVAMDYDGLERNFAGLTYNDMYLSPNGISP